MSSSTTTRGLSSAARSSSSLRRLLRREPSRETHQRLLRTEIAAVIAVVALEASQLLRHG